MAKTAASRWRWIITGSSFILGKTLGLAMGSANLAALWGMMQTAPQSFQDNAARVGFHPGPDMGEEVFQAIVDHPEGLWVGRLDPEKNMDILMTEDKKVHVFIPELADWLKGIDVYTEQKALERNPDYPLILMAGRHYVMNANTLMRDPAWNAGRRAGTMTMHPADAETLKLNDGQTVRVTTEAGSVEVELEITGTAKRGHVVIPHGFGLVYQGKAFGANVNRLTKNTHRDQLAATPLHRYVPCRVEAIAG